MLSLTAIKFHAISILDFIEIIVLLPAIYRKLFVPNPKFLFTILCVFVRVFIPLCLDITERFPQRREGTKYVIQSLN